MTLRQRFEAKVDRSGGPDACHPWTASRQKRGYGFFAVRRKNQLAHRVAFQLSTAPIPDGLCVLHDCDNPRCCNPKHLFLGTHKDNMRDMVRKGRQGRPPGPPIGSRAGERSAWNKLTNHDVVAIRELRGREPQRATAHRFGVSQGAVSMIQNKKRWSHLGDDGLETN